MGERRTHARENGGGGAQHVYIEVGSSSADNMVAIHEQSTPFNNQCNVLEKVHARVSWIQAMHTHTLRFKVFWMSGYNHEIILLSFFPSSFSFLVAFIFIFHPILSLTPICLYKNLIVPNVAANRYHSSWQ